MRQDRALGLLGKKVGMTQIYKPDGTTIPVTVIELGPCQVLAKKTAARTETGRTDGYTALKLGFGERRARSVNKPEAGTYKKLNTTPKAFVREFRVAADVLAKYEIGQSIGVDIFEGVEFVDLIGTSKGRGFQGVMRRHNFKGYGMTHGTHEFRRHGGSIGNRTFPGRVFKGRGMPGQMGSERVTTQNVRVVEIDREHNIMLVNGSVPGYNNGYIMVRPAIKKMGKKAATH
jgi:large subunit ribosomal protein L3